MPGQPKKRGMIAALEKRTRERFDDEPDATHLDYVEDWQASGKTLNALGVELGLGADEGEFISRYLRKTFGADETAARLSRARAHGAHRLNDGAMAIADAATPDDVQVARLRASARQWAAERWNREEYGQAKGPSVTINVSTLMLDALRQPQPNQNVIASVIAEDAEVVSIEPATASLIEQRSTEPLQRIEAPSEQGELF